MDKYSHDKTIHFENFLPFITTTSKTHTQFDGFSHFLEKLEISLEVTFILPLFI